MIILHTASPEEETLLRGTAGLVATDLLHQKRAL